MKRYRAIFGMMCLLMLVIGLAGCGNTATESTTAPTQSTDPSPSPPPTPTLAAEQTPTINPAWQIGESEMPVPRGETAAAAIDGLIYVPGGLVSVTYTVNGTTVLAIYDPATDSWSEGTPLPYAKFHQAVVSHDGKLYVLGGDADTAALDEKGADFAPNRHAFVYDPETDQWDALPDMPDDRHAAAAVSLGEYIYVVGGWSVWTTTPPMLRYHPIDETWETLAPLNSTRDHLAAVVLNGKIYAIGGRDVENNQFASVEIYDVQTDSWEFGPPINDTRAGFAAGVVDGKIYIAGGELEFARVRSAEVFDPETESWTVLGDMPISLHGCGSASIDGVFYILAGSKRPQAVVPFPQVLSYTP